MSGRAGRRGLDSRGMVILLLSEEIERDDLAKMMHGDALPLTSSFRLRFNTLLRLYGMESLQPEALVKQSFYAFQRAGEVSGQNERRASLLDEVAAMRQEDETRLQQLLTLRASRQSLMAQAAKLAFHPRYSLRFLQPGRLARVHDGAIDRGWGVVLGFRHDFNRLITPELVEHSGADDYVVDILLACVPDAAALALIGAVPPPASLSDDAAEAHVLPVRLSALTQLSAARLWLPIDLRTERARRLVLDGMRELMTSEARLGTARRADLACLGVVEHLGCTDAACGELVARAQALQTREEELTAELLLQASEEGGSGGGGGGGGDGGGGGGGEEEEEEESEGEESGEAAAAAAAADVGEKIAGQRVGSARDALESHLAVLARQRELEAAAAACASEAMELATNEFGEQTVRMQSVLRRLGHLDDENVVQLKGRAAAEMEACDELVAAELILGGVFNDLTPQAAVALCACLVAEQSEKVKKPQAMHADLVAPFAAVQEAARTLAGVLNEAVSAPQDSNPRARSALLELDSSSNIVRG